MATRFATLFRDSSTTPHMVAWTQFIEDVFVTSGGWVVTGDTGQTLPSAMTACTLVNQKKGYRIYRMNDSLQASAPVFMRIDYGCGGATSNCGLWVTIGQGSDGAGNITGILWNGGISASPNVINATTGVSGTALNSYGSAAPNRISLGLFVSNSSAFQLVFCLERTKDATGADTPDGLLLVYHDVSNTVNRSRYIINAVGVQPTAEAGLAYILTGINPSETFAPGDIGVGVIIHFKGVAQQPGVNFLAVNSSDVGAEGSFSVNLYGATRTFQHLFAIAPTKVLTGTFSIDTSARCCIRFD